VVESDDDDADGVCSVRSMLSFVSHFMSFHSQGTTLHYAAYSGSVQVVEALLETKKFNGSSISI